MPCCCGRCRSRSRSNSWSSSGRRTRNRSLPDTALMATAPWNVLFRGRSMKRCARRPGASPGWRRNNDRYNDPATFWVVIVARLKAGVSIRQAQEEASALFRNEMVHGAKPLLKEADEPAVRLERTRQGLNDETHRIAPMLYVI